MGLPCVRHSGACRIPVLAGLYTCISAVLPLLASSPHSACISLPLLAALQTLPTLAADSVAGRCGVSMSSSQLSSSGCIVTVGMPPAQAEAMRAALLLGAGLQKLWEVLGSTEVANAEATVEERPCQNCGARRAVSGMYRHWMRA